MEPPLGAAPLRVKDRISAATLKWRPRHTLVLTSVTVPSDRRITGFTLTALTVSWFTPDRRQ